jgi:hypothetical protein
MVQRSAPEAAMAAHFLRMRDLNHSPSLDWLLVLMGALAAWLLWPTSPF